ncbi:hypothetical protein AAZX31_01G090600 [Glycine max]
MCIIGVDTWVTSFFKFIRFVFFSFFNWVPKLVKEPYRSVIQLILFIKYVFLFFSCHNPTSRMSPPPTLASCWIPIAPSPLATPPPPSFLIPQQHHFSFLPCACQTVIILVSYSLVIATVVMIFPATVRSASSLYS